MTSTNDPTQPPAPAIATTDPDSWSEPARLDVRAEDALNVHVPGFDGPLDLLLALARTHKIDLSRISVLALADQYLAFVVGAKALRIELAGDYLVMAAWLAFLKSRLLLPREKTDDPALSGEEMAARLAFRLQRLDAMRQAAAQLMTRKRLGADIFPRGMPEGVRVIRDRQYTAEIYDLLTAYTVQRARTTVKRVHVVKKRTVWSIKDARQRLEVLVGQASGDWVQLDMLLEQYMQSEELAKTTTASSFGATLEMAREGVIELQQAAPFEPIYMRKRSADGQSAGDWQKVE
jgi:segregation and condensation protein A